MIYVAGDGPLGCHHYPKCPAAVVRQRLGMINQMLGVPNTHYEQGTCTMSCRVRDLDAAEGKPQQPTRRDPVQPTAPAPATKSMRKKRKALPMLSHEVLLILPSGKIIDIGS